MHSTKLLMVQNEAVPRELGGVGDLGLGLITFHDLVSHCSNTTCQNWRCHLDFKR